MAAPQTQIICKGLQKFSTTCATDSRPVMRDAKSRRGNDALVNGLLLPNPLLEQPGDL